MTKNFIAFSACLASFACTQDTFVVQPLSVKNVRVTGESSDLTKPRNISFTVMACMNASSGSSTNASSDVATYQHRPAIDQAFEISGGEETVTLKSDANGCVYWPESLTYQYLTKENFIKISRKITGKGAFTGTKDLSYAMNPWKGTADGFIDLRFAPIIDEKKETPNLQAVPAHLLVHEVSVHTYDSQTSSVGTSISVQLSMKPEGTRMGLDGVEIREPIRKGQFKLEVFLIEQARTGKTSDDTLLAQQIIGVSSEDGVINVLTRLTLSKIPNPTSQIGLAFRLSAEGFGTQESMVVLDQLLTQNTLTIQTSPQALEAYQAPKTAAFSNSNSGFQIDSIKIDSGGVIETDPSTGMASKISARITACVKDAISLKPIVNHTFLVGISSMPDAADSDLNTKVSDSSGCLYWQQNMSFDYYAREKWLDRDLLIRSKQGPYIAVQTAMKVSLNPWQTGSLFFWDSRSGVAPTNEILPATVGNAHIDVKDLSYTFIGRDFQYDSSRQLSMNRHYQFRFKPFVVREKSYNNDISFEPLRTGQLSLRALLVAHQHPFSMSIVNAEIVDGEVAVEISFPFSMDQLPLVMNRNELVLEVMTAKKDSTLEGATLVAPFVGIDPEKTIGLSLTQKTIGEMTQGQTVSIHDSNAAYTAVEEVSNKTYVLNAIASVAFNDEISTQDSNATQDVNSTYTKKSTGKKTYSNAKNYVNDKNYSNAKAYVDVHAKGGFELFGNGAEVQTGGQIETGTGSETGSVSESGAESESGVEGGYCFNRNWYTAHVTGRGNVLSRGLSLTKVRPLVAERIELKSDAIKGHSEVWYFVHPQDPSSMVLLDVNKTDQQDFTKVIHGDKDFAKFKRIFENAENTILFKKESKSK